MEKMIQVGKKGTFRLPPELCERYGIQVGDALRLIDQDGTFILIPSLKKDPGKIGEIETHPYKDFVPKNARYLILGSFTGKEAIQGKSYSDETYDWYYGTSRNQFWSILERVYGVHLKDLQSKQDMFTKLGIAITDIIRQVIRREGSNLDTNLDVVEYNRGIGDIVNKYPIEKIYFTSRFVESTFKREFRELSSQFPVEKLIYLPSPSPRYARMSLEKKIIEYKKLLPEIRPDGESG